MEHQVHRELVELQVQVVHREVLVRQELAEHQVHRELVELQVLQEAQVHQVQVARQV